MDSNNGSEIVNRKILLVIFKVLEAVRWLSPRCGLVEVIHTLHSTVTCHWTDCTIFRTSCSRNSVIWMVGTTETEGLSRGVWRRASLFITYFEKWPAGWRKMNSLSVEAGHIGSWIRDRRVNVDHQRRHQFVSHINSHQNDFWPWSHTRTVLTRLSATVYNIKWDAYPFIFGFGPFVNKRLHFFYSCSYVTIWCSLEAWLNVAQWHLLKFKVQFFL